MHPPRIAHLDLTAFFVSVERALHPEWIGQPIIVAGDPQKRGVVTCASYEVRKYGVRAGMATSLALKKCPIAIRVKSTFGAYQDYSRRVRNILKPYAPVFEIASIDEFYLDWTGCERLFGKPFTEIARSIQDTIRKELSLPCAIGIASNKMMAKIACDRAKPTGILEIPEGEEAEFLESLPASVLPGIGEYMTEQLARYNIRTCGDLAKLPVDFVARRFGQWGLYILESARGEGSQELSTGHERKQMSTEETFPDDTRDMSFIRIKLHEMTAYLSEDMRTAGRKARTVRVKIRYHDWMQHSRQTTVQPTYDPVTLYKIALRLFAECDREKKPIRLIGVGCVLEGEDAALDLFDDESQHRRDELLKTVDSINRKFDKPVVKIGSGE